MQYCYRGDVEGIGDWGCKTIIKFVLWKEKSQGFSIIVNITYLLKIVVHLKCCYCISLFAYKNLNSFS